MQKDLSEKHSTTYLREKIINLIAREAEGMALLEIKKAMKEAYSYLEENAVIEIVNPNESEET